MYSILTTTAHTSGTRHVLARNEGSKDCDENSNEDLHDGWIAIDR